MLYCFECCAFIAQCVHHTVMPVGRTVIKWYHVHSDAHKQHTYTHTGTGTHTNTKQFSGLPVRDQETSILRGELFKMFQKVIHHQTRVTSVTFVGRKVSKYHPTLRIGPILCKVYTSVSPPFCSGAAYWGNPSNSYTLYINTSSSKQVLVSAESAAKLCIILV